MENTVFVKIPKAQEIPPWYVVHVSRPNGYTFTYGQYVELFLPEGKKYLALASSPSNEAEIWFILKSKKIVSFPRELWMSKPKGGFPLIQDKEKIFLITNGVGISAFTGLLYDLAHGLVKKDFICLWGIRFPQEKELLEHLDIPPHLVTTIYSRHTEGLQGYVQDHIENFISPDMACYISGSQEMAKSTEEKLISLGIPKNQIFYNF